MWRESLSTAAMTEDCRANLRSTDNTHMSPGAEKMLLLHGKEQLHLPHAQPWDQGYWQCSLSYLFLFWSAL